MWTSSFSAYTCCLLPSNHASLWRAWLHLLNNLPIGTKGLLLAPPKAFTSSEQTRPASSYGMCSSSQPSWYPFFCHFVIIRSHEQHGYDSHFLEVPLMQKAKRRNSKLHFYTSQIFLMHKRGKHLLHVPSFQGLPCNSYSQDSSGLPQNPPFRHYPALQERLTYWGCTALITCVFLQNKLQAQICNWRLRGENEAEETNMGLGGHAHFKHPSVKALITQFCFPWRPKLQHWIPEKIKSHFYIK